MTAKIPVRKSVIPVDNLGPCDKCAKFPGKYQWHHDDGKIENLCLTCCHEYASKEWGVIRRRTY